MVFALLALIGVAAVAAIPFAFAYSERRRRRARHALYARMGRLPSGAEPIDVVCTTAPTYGPDPAPPGWPGTDPTGGDCTS